MPSPVLLRKSACVSAAPCCPLDQSAAQSLMGDLLDQKRSARGCSSQSLKANTECERIFLTTNSVVCQPVSVLQTPINTKG